MERPTPRQVTNWLVDLSRLAAPGRDVELGAAFRAYAEMLLDRFDSRAFNAASRAYVAERCKFWPTYGELVEHLDAWWANNRPDSRPRREARGLRLPPEAA